ncbi:MAG: AI-2E family transporter [Candidatus Zixiibacteriota bacterium]|nr:MAG: AI-2E family transporter [candidate division Zixibacteria bacterium]
MKREYILVSLFFLIAAIVFYLFYQLIIPFFAPMAWAGVFAILFFPLYERLLQLIKSKGLSSLLVCILIIVLIIGPITYLFVALVSEAANAVAKVNAMIKSGELEQLLSIDLPWIEAAKEKLSKYYDLSKINLDEIVKQSMESVSGVILNQTSWLITNTTRLVFYFVLMIFTLYYFFKDGESLVHTTKRLMPLTANQVNVTFRQLHDVIQATMYGGVVVALIQGLIGGILFAIVGIPSPVFWGAIMAFLSIIPFVGAFIVYVPAGLILIIGGSYIKGIIVIAVGSVVISQIDNVLRPFLISGRTSMHPLLLFFTILGGIYLFGLLGIVLGPLIAAVFVTLLKIFEFKLHPETEASLTRELDM